MRSAPSAPIVTSFLSFQTVLNAIIMLSLHLGLFGNFNLQTVEPGAFRAERGAAEMKSTQNHEVDWLTGTD